MPVSVVGIALNPRELALVVRAVRELVDRDGGSQASEDVLSMLEAALPAGALEAFEEFSSES
jgi:hypothetical protein